MQTDPLLALYRMLGSFRWDTASVSALTGIDVPTLEARVRLGHVMLDANGDVFSVKGAR